MPINPFLYADPEVTMRAVEALKGAKGAPAGAEGAPVQTQQQYVPEAEDMPADPGNFGNIVEGGAVGEELTDGAFQLSPIQQQQAGVIQPKGYDPYRFGGRETIDEATSHQPEIAAGATEELGKVRETEHKNLSDVYGQESERQTRDAAIEQAQRAAEQQEFARRQALIDKKSDEIANHQVSRGRFWKNPGNILSAIGASLMTLGSDDHTVGIRLINNAIQQDVEEQRYDHEAMQADLTGLRTNVGMYRQLVNDRQGGDMLHEAKMRDVAAQKLMQISESMRSKEAKQAGIAEAALLRQQAAQIRMGVYQKMTVMPQRVAPDMRSANMAGGYEVAPPFAAPAPQGQQAPTAGQSPYPTAQQFSNQSSRPSQSTQSPAQPGRYTGVDKKYGGPPAAPELGDTVNNGTTSKTPEQPSGGRTGTVLESDDEKLNRHIEERTGIKGVGSLVANYNRKLHARATLQGKLPGTKQHNEWIEAQRKQAVDSIEKLSSQHANYVAGDSYLGQVQGDFNRLRKTFTEPSGEVNYQKMDKFLSQNWKFVSEKGVQFVQRTQDALVGTEDLSDKERAAAEAIGQRLQFAINAYIHDVSGGSVTQNEEVRNRLTINGSMTSRNIVNFVNTSSTARAAQLENLLSGTNQVPALIWMAQRGIKYSRLPSPKTSVPGK